jgi:hypothetical protein
MPQGSSRIRTLAEIDLHETLTLGSRKRAHRASPNSQIDFSGRRWRGTSCHLASVSSARLSGSIGNATCPG